MKKNKLKNNKILLLGAGGFLGQNLLSLMKKKNYKKVFYPSRDELNLLDSKKTDSYIYKLRPSIIILLAAKVGGIGANIKYPIEFLRENILIQDNVYQAASKYSVKKILFMASSCMYPRLSKQPMLETYLNTGSLEQTNESYALAKIVGLKMAESHFKIHKLASIIPISSNIYGKGDKYNLDNSHVISALVKKFVDAKHSLSKTVEIWGDGSARREFIYVDDVSRAILFFLERINSFKYFNLGTGQDITIKDLSLLIKKKTGYKGQLFFNNKYPNGMKKKLMSNQYIREKGFKCLTDLDKGIDIMVNEYENSKFKK